MASHLEVAYRWAQRSGPQGRLARDLRGHHMWMDGDEIFSYGRHFCLARWITLPDGERIILRNSEGYSVSTAKHRGIVWKAIHRYAGRAKVFTQPFGFLTDAAVSWYNAQIAECEAKAARARVYGPMHLEDAARLRQERDLYTEVLTRREAA